MHQFISYTYDIEYKKNAYDVEYQITKYGHKLVYDNITKNYEMNKNKQIDNQKLNETIPLLYCH